MNLRIGTRGSKLAIAQAEWVMEKIKVRHAQVDVSIIKIKTKGDKILDSPLSRIGGKGLFVKEIEETLLTKNIDIAVHSMKDVPTELAKGLQLFAFPKREDPRDVIVSIDNREISELAYGAIIGTGSLRRSSQLKQIRPDLNVIDIRGNVDSRLRKLETEDLQGIILAAAGLKRLGLIQKISHFISTKQMLPAVGQGALGIEIRKEDEETKQILSFLNDYETEITVGSERAFLKELEGGCQVPIGAHAHLESDCVILDGMIASLDGSRVIRESMKGDVDNPKELGVRLAKNLYNYGGKDILESIGII